MLRRRIGQWVIGVCALWLGLCALPAAAETPFAGGTLIKLTDFHSQQVIARQVSIWLPPGYATGNRRYRVIYMHDGQNLFEPADAYGGKTWGIAETLVATRREAIVVGIWNTRLRGREYFPQKVFDRLPPAQQENATTTHGGTPLSDAYLRFIVTELKPYVDRTWRTLPGPADTAMMGSSMGGLISLYAMAEYPQVFGQVACLSVHWPLGDPRRGDPAAVSAAWAATLATSLWRPGTNRLYMDHGTLTLDSYYRPYSLKIEAVLEKRGWHRDQDWISRVFEGGEHNETSWRARLDVPVKFLLPAQDLAARSGPGTWPGAADYHRVPTMRTP